MFAKKYPTQDDILNDIVDCSIFDNKIIISGSRGFYDYDFFARELKEIISGIKGNTIFYSGMASSGADKLIIRFCKEEGYLYYPYPADWDRFGKRAGFLRNNQMAETATWLIAFHDGVSPGTKHMINICRDKELRLNIVNISDLNKPKKIKLYTIQMVQWRLAEAIGVKFIDITAKSGIEAFAPLMENVLAYKNGLMPESEYTRLYNDKMFSSKEKNEKFWKHLLKFEAMAFGCYCPPNSFCHRHIFINLVKEYLEQNDLEVEMCGELTKERVDNEFALIINAIKDN